MGGEETLRGLLVNNFSLELEGIRKRGWKLLARSKMGRVPYVAASFA